MQNRIIYKNFAVFWVSACMMLVTAMAVAESSGSRYSVQLIGGRSNVWALPEPQTQDVMPESQQRSGYQKQESGRPGAGYYRGERQQSNRFVTPEFLESLKRQQTQHQLMPGSEQYYQQAPQRPLQQSMQQSMQQPGEQYNLPGYYENPSYGMGYVNPLYDTPVISPWSQGPDVLYRGESFPLVPNEAIGGVAPMHVDPFASNQGKDGPANEDIQRETNVFDPFNFGRFGNMK